MRETNWQPGDRVQVKKGHPRAYEIGILLELKFMSIPNCYMWLVDFDPKNNLGYADRGWYPIKNLKLFQP